MPTCVRCRLPKAGRLTGATLACRVFDHWSHLPDLQFRALGRMALTALDQSNGDVPAATYFGGHERIAKAWRSPFPDDDGTPETRKRRKNILNEVRKTMRGLEVAGAVKVLDTGKPPGPGHAQAYLLTVLGRSRPVVRLAEHIVKMVR